MSLSRIFLKIRPFAPVLAAYLMLSASCGRGTYCRIEGFAQGGTWQMVCRLPAGVTPDRIRSGADSILDGIDRSLSGYNRGSILTKVNEAPCGEAVKVDGHFIRVFEISQRMWRHTGGAFDPSAGALFDLWGFGFDSPQEPSRQAIDSVMAFCGMDKFSLTGSSIVKTDSRSRLNFNAIAQGYTCDTLARFLEGLGCRDYLVDIGGEIICAGLNPGGQLWTIGVETPSRDNPDDVSLADTLYLTDCAVVTSGNYRKHTASFGHIIDPRTGRPSTQISRRETVTVHFGDTICGAAADWPCSTADALATAKVLH